MRIVVVVLVLAVVTAGGLWYRAANAQAAPDYRVAKVERGDLLSSVNATGTLEPEEVVDVGAQVDGLIESFGTDSVGNTIDYRSPVEAGMVLAKIDDAVYRADLNTAQAQLDQGVSAREKGNADVDQSKAKSRLAEQNWLRAQQLGPSDALSKTDYENYQAEYETAKANVAVAQAEISLANANIHAAQAALDKARRNLDFCTIRSPVKGVIIDRRVNIGQTVVSNLSASSMFLIAKDLAKLQVWVAVNEADVSRIKPGQPVTFNCDALTGESFKGTVNKVRLNAQNTQNVVVYTVEVNTDNADGKLLPYWTANVEFEVRRDANALLVPNAAIRWYPDAAAQVSPDVRSQWRPVEDEDEQMQRSASAGAAAPTGKPIKKTERRGKVWVKDGSFVRPVEVKLGPTDSLNTAVTPVEPDGLKEGQQVVVGEQVDSGNDASENDPFLPKMKRRK